MLQILIHVHALFKESFCSYAWSVLIFLVYFSDAIDNSLMSLWCHFYVMLPLYGYIQIFYELTQRLIGYRVILCLLCCCLFVCFPSCPYLLERAVILIQMHQLYHCRLLLLLIFIFFLSCLLLIRSRRPLWPSLSQIPVRPQPLLIS